MTTDDRPLLLCYDGSDDAKHAIQEAAAAFATRRASVLSVWQDVAALPAFAWAGASLPDLEDVFAAARDGARRVADEGAKVATEAGFEAEPLVGEAHGPIWTAVVETADQRGVQAIVAGSRGLTGLKSVLVGSVSGGIVHYAHCPVFIVRRDGER